MEEGLSWKIFIYKKLYLDFEGNFMVMEKDTEGLELYAIKKIKRKSLKPYEGKKGAISVFPDEAVLLLRKKPLFVWNDEPYFAYSYNPEIKNSTLSKFGNKFAGGMRNNNWIKMMLTKKVVFLILTDD